MSKKDHFNYCGLCGAAVWDWDAHKTWHESRNDLLLQVCEALDERFAAIRYFLTGVKP